jgi:DNA-binding NtrC family response regulator
VSTTAEAYVPVPVATPATILYLPAAFRDPAEVRAELQRVGLAVTVAADATEALRLLAGGRFTMCVVDLGDEARALPSIRAIRAQYPELPLAGVMDAARPLLSADAVHAGVNDVLNWPFEPAELAATVANARDRVGVHVALPTPAAAGVVLFAHAPAMRVVMEMVRAAARGRGGVLVAGEPGTGRELVARAVHALGARPHSPFVRVDCASLAPDVLEQILFGVSAERRGPAAGRRSLERLGVGGAMHRAIGGTLLVAGLLEASERAQMKLARIMRDGEAVLASEPRAAIEIDVRVMAASGPQPEAAVSDGRLRRDLYDRLSQTRIDVPTLRRRREDIPLLAVHILRELAAQQGVAPPRFTRSALALLSALPWAGNGNELRDVLETLFRSVRRPVVEIDDLLEHVRLDGVSPRVEASGTLRDAKARFERDWISAVLVKHHGRMDEAARALGIQRTNLYRKVRQLKVARSLIVPRRS